MAETFNTDQFFRTSLLRRLATGLNIMQSINLPDHLQLPPQKVYGCLRENYTEDNSDITFIDQESKRTIAAHKSVLSVVSDVFFKMFQGDWKEKNSNVMPIPDEYSFEVFSTAMSFLYGDVATLLSPEDAIGLFKIAHFYNLLGLKESLAELVTIWQKSKMNMDSRVISLCTCVCGYEASTLCKNVVFRASLSYIVNRLDGIKELQDFLLLPIDAVLEIVKSEDVSISEIDLFELLQKWVKRNNDRGDGVSTEQIMELYDYLRYGTMSKEDLLYKVAGERYKSSQAFAVALQQHQMFCSITIKSNFRHFLVRKAQAISFRPPFFPLKKYSSPRSFEKILLRAPPIPKSNLRNGVAVVYEGYQPVSYTIDNSGEDERMPVGQYNIAIIIDSLVDQSTHTLNASTLIEGNPVCISARLSLSPNKIVSVTPLKMENIRHGSDKYLFLQEEKTIDVELPWIMLIAIDRKIRPFKQR